MLKLQLRSKFTKRVARNCPTKNVTTESTKTHFPILTELRLSARLLTFFILLSRNVCLNSWGKKKKNLLQTLTLKLPVTATVSTQMHWQHVFRLSSVLLGLHKCILSCAIQFVYVRSSLGNLSLFEIARASVLFSRIFLRNYALRKWNFF